MTGLSEAYLDDGGRRLRYLHGGSGPPLVLCHGFLGSAENFATWFETLLPLRTLVVPDLPGCGDSTPLARAHTADELAASIEPLLDHLGVDEFDLGGLCLGASVACALARRRPDAVRRLLLHTPLLDPSLVRRRFRVQARVMTAPGLFGGVIWLSRRRVVSDLYKRLLVEGSDVDREAAEANFRNQVRADPRATREWLRDGLVRRDAGLVARRAEPTLVIAAADDRICAVERLAALAATWPAVRFAAIADAGHGWTAEQVRRQLEEITAFLGAPEPAAAAG